MIKIIVTVFLACLQPLSMHAAFVLNEMTLEEKVGQLLMVHFQGEESNEQSKILVQQVHVGGIIYYNWANGLHSPCQVRDLSNSLQQLAKKNRIPIPLFIAVDQEGGVVTRLTKGFTIFPGNKALGMTRNPEFAELSALAMGQELRCVGINMNLSPVVDINNNPRNPVIGIRSFGDSVDTVLSFAKKALKGYHQAGIITSFKHFPGHGDVEVDSHIDLPILNKSKEELLQVELRPFSELANQTEAVMTAHIMVSALDPIHCTTLSKRSLDYLRTEIGFKGIIISDSLVMNGLLKNCSSIDDAAILAINAGCDILILGGKQLLDSRQNLELTVADVQRIHRTLVNAVIDGIIPEKKINESVQRIIDLKNHTLAKSSEDELKLNLEELVNTKEHQALAKKIALLALRAIPDNFIPIFYPKNIVIISPELIRESIIQSSFLQIKTKTTPLFFTGLAPTHEQIIAANDTAKDADLIIFFSYQAWKNPSQAGLIHSLVHLGKPFILIAVRDPIDTSLITETEFQNTHLSIQTFSPILPSIEAACDLLTSKYFRNNEK